MKRKVLYAAGILLGLFVLLLIIVSAVPEQPKTDQLIVNAEQAATTTSPAAPSISSEEVVAPDSQIATSASSLPQQSGLVKVISVVDGDTIKVSIDGTTQTLRLIGMDTPEVVDPRKPVQCFGKEASDKAKAILTGQMVRLESDPTQGELDKYQRLLRYVFLADGTSYNKMMIAQGYAHEYTYDLPYKYQAEYKAAQAAAQKAQLGLWNPATCNGNTTTAAATSSPPATPTQPTPVAQSSGHVFYLSTYYTAKYYYCDTDPGWKSLSSQYLKSYPSEQALLAAYPSRTLHASCE